MAPADRPVVARRSGGSDARLAERIAEHRASVRELLEKAGALAGEQWLTPRAEGKWTPAQEVKHVLLFYEAFMRDLGDVQRLGLRGTPWKRRIWKLLGLTFIIWRKRIPVAVRAPREARPDWETTPALELLPRLQRRAEAFDSLFASKWITEPDRRVTHPFFGEITLDHAIQIAIVHTRHHAAFLPEARSVARPAADVAPA